VKKQHGKSRSANIYLIVVDYSADTFPLGKPEVSGQQSVGVLHLDQVVSLGFKIIIIITVSSEYVSKNSSQGKAAHCIHSLPRKRIMSCDDRTCT
jgi:hypothetical protein